MSMDKAYSTSKKIFTQVSIKHNPALLDQLKSLDKKDIIVIDGVHDHVEQLLTQIDIPYTLISPGKIAQLDYGRVMFANCREYGTNDDFDDEKETNSNKSKSSIIKGARNFVERGGRLITTDWAIDLLTKAFPGKLYKTETSTSDDVVEIQCGNDLAKKFIGLSYTECHPKWWLEGSSYVYKNGKDSEDVIDLIVSKEMEKKYGQKHIASAFQYGNGEVFHFISHFILQRSHQTIKADYGKLEDFLKKMDAHWETGMHEANVAELEAAFSTLNTIANLCSPYPILSYSTDGKSMTHSKTNAPKSIPLLGDGS